MGSSGKSPRGGRNTEYLVYTARICQVPKPTAAERSCLNRDCGCKPIRAVFDIMGYYGRNLLRLTAQDDVVILVIDVVFIADINESISLETKGALIWQ